MTGAFELTGNLGVVGTIIVVALLIILLYILFEGR